MALLKRNREMNKRGKPILILLVLGALVACWTTVSYSARVKDIATVGGVRDNQLIGFGLVVGLKNSGDRSRKSPFTAQTLIAMLERLGTTIDVRQLADPRIGTNDVRNLRDLRIENVAAAMVTADLPPFARTGSRIDVVVSSLGDAKSLQGGTLLLSPLKAANGEVYATAQGPISVGGAYLEGTRGTTVQKNHPTVARIVGGALVEKEVPLEFEKKKDIDLLLHQPDFTTNNRMVTAINARFGENTAAAKDSGTIKLKVPPDFQNKIVEFVASVEALDVQIDGPAKVILDERTGTIVIGENVQLSPVAVSHGELMVRIEEKPEVSQPEPLSQGETVKTAQVTTRVQEKPGTGLFEIKKTATISELVRALNAVGVSPRDLIAIFQSLKAAGALQAELEII